MVLVVDKPKEKLVGPLVNDYFKFNGRLYHIESEKIDDNGRLMYETENCFTLYRDWIEARLLRRIEVIIPDVI